MENLPLACVHPSLTNPRKRFDEAELNELAESIRQHEVMQPILVRPMNKEEVLANKAVHHEYEIIAGERRYRASKIAGKETIPAIIRDLDDITALQLQILENLQRSDLHPLEEANGFKALLANTSAKSWTIDQLAEKVGKSRSYIYASLKLTELCTYAQDAFYDGKLKRETAILIARIPGEKLQTLATKEITTPDYQGSIPSYRQALRTLQDRFTLKLSSAPFKITDANLLPDAGSCKSCSKRTGNSPELFPDIESADVCTDPDCFGDKRQAHVAQLKASGEQVLDGADAKKIMPHRWDLDPKYVKLEENCPGSADSLQKALGKDVAGVITVVDPDSRDLIQVMKKTDVQEALKAKGIEVTFTATRSHSAQEKENERKAKIENAYRVKLLGAISKAIEPQLKKDFRLEDYEQAIIARYMLSRLDHETTRRLLKFLGIGFTNEEGPYKATEQLSKSISESMNSADRMLLMMQMALIGECNVNGYSMNEGKNLHMMAINNRIDEKTLRKEAEAEFAPKPKSNKAEEEAYAEKFYADLEEKYGHLISADNDGWPSRRLALEQQANIAKQAKSAPTPPIAAQAPEEVAPETQEPGEPSAQAEEAKPLPPKLQEIKAKALAKKAKKQSKEVSANADAETTASTANAAEETNGEATTNA